MVGQVAALAGTITAVEAAATSWDLIIVGAGPAGGTIAIRTARAGLRVLLIDRELFPRPKVCGCCLSLLALAELNDLNLAATQQRLASPQASCQIPLDTVQLIAAGRAASLRLPAGGVQSRESLDPAVVRAAIDAGAAWLPQTRVTSCRPTATSVNVLVAPANNDEQNFSCDRLVLAGGLADAVRIETPSGSRPADRRRSPNNRIGVGATLPSASGSLPAGLLAMAVGRSGYCGLVRLEDGRIDLAAALIPAAVATAGTPAKAVADLLEKAGGQRLHLVERTDVEAALFRATPSLTHRTPIVDPTSDRIFRAGDATGYVEPFTGEGIGWALHAARLLAESVLSPAGQLRPPAEAAARYRQRHRLGLRLRHRRCRLVALALRSPLFVSTAVRAASWFPTAASCVAHCCTGNAAELFLGRTAGLR
jgi:flavin-dependent dehydrogenase